MIPGEYRLKPDEIVCHPDRQTIRLIVLNRGDRPVQVGSHVHFYEVNAALDFDRTAAFGHRCTSLQAPPFVSNPAKRSRLNSLLLAANARFTDLTD